MWIQTKQGHPHQAGIIGLKDGGGVLVPHVQHLVLLGQEAGGEAAHHGAGQQEHQHALQHPHCRLPVQISCSPPMRALLGKKNASP